MQFLPALPARDYEPCVLEDSQVLHDAEARHLQLRLKLGQRAAVTLKEQVEQEATRRVTERLKHTVLVLAHASTIGDHTVTCQASLKTVASIPFAPTLVSEVGDGDARAIGWTAYLGAMPTALGFATWSYALSRASAVAALNYLIPVVAILLGWMYLGERPSILAVAGGSLCLVCVYVARHGRVKRRR
jgi:uncharacterized membrane protein